MIQDFRLRLASDLKLPIPGLLRPDPRNLQKIFPWIKEIDGRDVSPIAPITLRLGTVLQNREGGISGFEYKSRLHPLRQVRRLVYQPPWKASSGLLGYQQALWIVEHRDELPSKVSAGMAYLIDFPGLRVLSWTGAHCSPYLRLDELQIGWRDISIADFTDLRRIAVSDEVLAVA